MLKIKRCHWVSFFTDCEHEVMPVEEGYRVTLAYNLYFQDETRLPAFQAGGYPTQVYEGNSCNIVVL